MKLLLGSLALSALLIASDIAQSPNTASVVVTVVDQNGALIPGAKVTLTNQATGSVRDTLTGDEGST
ncbi:MAG TPA: carboxypeptidase-like regulatory domain-containing protein, partial [Pyrinomonadaceae bacterium]